MMTQLSFDPQLARAIVARVVAGIPETEELHRSTWWLESMLAPGLEIVSVEELDRMYRERTQEVRADNRGAYWVGEER